MAKEQANSRPKARHTGQTTDKQRTEHRPASAPAILALNLLSPSCSPKAKDYPFTSKLVEKNGYQTQLLDV
jgi:hypothetical protein